MTIGKRLPSNDLLQARWCRTDNRFYGWWLLGRAGVYGKLGISFDDSMILSMKHPRLFSVIGRISIFYYNLTVRAHLIWEILTGGTR